MRRGPTDRQALTVFGGLLAVGALVIGLRWLAIREDSIVTVRVLRKPSSFCDARAEG